MLSKHHEALDAAQRATDLYAECPLSHFNLGMTLMHYGRFVEASKALDRSQTLSSKRPEVSSYVAPFVAEAKHLAQLELRLRDVLNGLSEPTTEHEYAALVDMCYWKRKYADGVGLAQRAFRAYPSMVDNRGGGYGYKAACMALLVARRGGGHSDADRREAARSHELALGWLYQTIEAWKPRPFGPLDAEEVDSIETIRRWHDDPDLASIREDAALADLSEAERKACRKLWASVDAVCLDKRMLPDEGYVRNPSFEAQILAGRTRPWIDGELQGWALSDHFAGPQMLTREYKRPLPHGRNFAFSRGATISQVLTERLRANKRYTLTVQVGNALPFIFPGYRVQLWAGGELLAEDYNTQRPPNGEFTTSSVLYAAGAYHMQFAKPLEIRLLAPGIVDGTGQTQVNFDDVRFYVSNIDASE
jgi:tetratricopeptide (TPR) repeat protein